MAKKKKEFESQKPETPWHALDLEAVYKELGKDDGLPKSGLTTAEAEDRLSRFGENKLSEKEFDTGFIYQKLFFLKIRNTKVIQVCQHVENPFNHQCFCIPKERLLIAMIC